MANNDITHKTVIASISPHIRKELLERSDLAGTKHAICHFGLILLCSIYLILKLPFWYLVLPIQGILVVFLFTALHETIHATAFKTPWINKVIAHICGLIVFVPANWFKYFHFQHHRYTNQPDLDPELAATKPQTKLDYFKYLSGIPVGIALIKTLFKNAFYNNEDKFVPQNQKFRVRIESLVYLNTYVLLACISIWFNSSLLFWLWLIPLVLGQPFLRAYLLAEHALCPYVDNMLSNTRTTLTHSLIRFIAWNMPYHAEHHALPSVPFYKLPEFHQYLNEHLVNKEKGYLAFHKKMTKSLSHSH